MQTIENRKARFDFEILESFEAGLELLGHEVKSIKSGKANLSGAYARVNQNEVWLLGAFIAPYQEKNTPKEYDPYRSRRLLLRKKEISSLIGRTKEKGLTLVPIRLYNKKGRIKMELALGRARKKHDKREAIKKKDLRRELRRNV